MPRLRRKTPHEPVRAIPAPMERGPGALRRAESSTLRALALSLNHGEPRALSFGDDFPTMELSGPAQPLASFRERVASREGRAELLVFRVGTELFATELRAVEEAVEGAAARPIPDAPPAMLGIFALRDRTLPMYLLGRVLGFPGDGAGDMTLVMRPAGTRIALAVDEVDDVFEVALADIRSAPAAVEADGMVLGIAWRGSELVTLLDAEVIVDACIAVAPKDLL